jgi:hypothetical protein
MKSFPIRKRKNRTKMVLPEVRPHLSKPHLPKKIFWEVHKNENVYLGWKN